MTVFRLLFLASRARFASAIVLAVLGGAASSALLFVITEGMRHPTPSLLWAFAALCIARAVLELASHWTITLLTARLVQHLRLRIARASLSAPYATLEGEPLVRVRVGLIENAETIAAAAGTIVTATTACAAIVGGFGYLLWLSWAAAAASALLFAVMFLASKRLNNVAEAILDRRFPYLVKAGGAFDAAITGAKELKLNAARRRAFLAETVDPTLSGLHSIMMHGFTYLLGSEAFGQTAVFLALAASSATLAAFGVAGPVVMGVAITIVFLQSPLFAVLAAVPQIVDASVCSAALEQIFSSLSATPNTPRAASPVAALQSLELRDLTFAYPTADEPPFSVGPIDITISPGEILFVIGGNGSGKSTLAKVLVGLYAPSNGQILVNAKPVVSPDEVEDYRGLFAVVFAGGHVFKELWGVSARSVDETANALLADLQLAHKVRVTDGRFTTTELSQGQRKRLALVAAYLEDRPIHVFDEWAADQDPEFKRAFYTHFLPALRQAGKTAIVISHDDQYFFVANRVLRLERGRVLDIENVDVQVVA